jgi:hypothetical protein
VYTDFPIWDATTEPSATNINQMQDWTVQSSKFVKEIELYSGTVKIHKSRSKTVASRVKNVYDAATLIDLKATKTNTLLVQGSFAVLLATFEEISDYFALLQKEDNTLGKRVKSFGDDEEMFMKWNETLKTCSRDLDLVLADSVFDAAVDLQDFNQDVKELTFNLKGILEKIIGQLGTLELAVEASQKLLVKQEADRAQYKTQQAVKEELNFNPKLIRYEEIIGIGGNHGN